MESRAKISCQLKGIKWRINGTVQQGSRLSQEMSLIMGMTTSLSNFDSSSGLMLVVVLESYKLPYCCRSAIE